MNPAFKTNSFRTAFFELVRKEQQTEVPSRSSCFPVLPPGKVWTTYRESNKPIKLKNRSFDLYVFD